MRIFQDRQVGGKPGQAEEDRHHERGDEAAQLVLDVSRQDRRLADQHAGDERAEHGVDADRLRDQRHQAHHDQDRGDDRVFADESVVDPADQPEHQLAADRVAQDQEDARADHGLRERAATRNRLRRRCRA